MATRDKDETAVKHGIWVQNDASLDVAAAVDLGVAAEDAGWDGVFLSDTITDGFTEPWTILAGIAARTSRIRLGTWITPILRQQPWQVAHTLATLDRLSAGRVILGAGLGTRPEHDALGAGWKPGEMGEKYDEALAVIDGLWAGGSFSFSGEHFTLDGAELPVTPVKQPRIPILLAAWWPNEAPFVRGARWDGIMPYWPACLGGGEGPQGEQSSQSVEAEMREMLDYYHGLREDPGEIVLPIDPAGAGPTYADACREMGATWLLSTFGDRGPDFTLTEAVVREGPPTDQLD